jgi:uncharacterized protein (TIGR02677 family)
VTSRGRRWRAMPRDLFQPAVVESRDLHLGILSLFADRDLTDPALTLEQLIVQLPTVAPDLVLDDDSVKRSLTQLVEWGHLDESRNESATYRTPEEFQRRNLQWSLTGTGSAVIAGLDRAADFLGAVTSLQTATIGALAQSVAAAADLASQPDADVVEIHMEWQLAEGYLVALIDNVRQLQRRLAELMRDPALDDEVLRRARDVIIEYLTRFIHDAEEPANRARLALLRLHQLGPALVFQRALLGANLAPDPVRGDPSPAWLDERQRHLEALDEWFVRGREGAPPRMERLRQQGRDWVLSFLKVLDLRRTHHRRSAGIVEDFTALARAFASCQREDDAHRLAVAAFALHGARHHSALIEDVAGADPSVPAAENPAVPVDVQLRTRETGREVRGERPVRDARKERALKAREQAAKLQELERYRDGLLTHGTVRISTFSRLDYAQYRELLDLLCAALTTQPGRDGIRQCASSDGRVVVRITDDQPTTRTRLETIVGTLDVADYRVSIAQLGADKGQAAELPDEGRTA